MRVIFRLLGLVAGVVLLSVALIVLVLAALQSAAVRAVAEDAINKLVPGVTVEGLEAGLPSRLAVAHVAVSDDDGPWLDIERFRLVWAPTALLEGRAEVESLTIGTIALHRTPTGEAAPPEPTEQTEETPQALPERVFPVVVDELRVDALTLDEPVLGQSATFALEGSVDGALGTTVQAQLQVDRTDRDELSANLDALLDLAAATLKLDLSLTETSGLLAHVTKQPDVEPLELVLNGDGPLSGWSAALNLDAGTLATLETAIELAVPEPLSVSISGSVTPGTSLQTGGLAALVAEPIDFDLRAGMSDGTTTVERIAIDASWLTLEGTATLAGDALVADLTAASPDLAPLAPLAGGELEGSVALDINLDGPLPVPPGVVTLRGEGLAVGPARIASLNQRIDVASGDGGAITFALDGDVGGLELATPDGRLADDLTLRAQGSVVPGGALSVETVDVEGELLTLNGDANGDLGAGSIDARAALRLPELGALRAFSPAAPTGALDLNLTAALTDGFGRGDVDLSLTSTDLGELPAPAGALLGTTPSLDVALQLDPLPQIVLERLALVGAGLTVDADGAFALDSQDGRLNATVDVPALAPIGDELGQDLAGDVALELDAEGGVEGFTAEARLTGSDLQLTTMQFDDATLTFTADGTPSAVDGALTARLAHAGEGLSLNAGYELTPETLALNGLALDAPGATLAGDLDMALTGPTADGSVTGDAELGQLGDWLGLPLAGTIDLSLALDSEPAQGADVDVSVRSLNALGVTVAAADIEATGDDLLGALQLNASVTASGVAQGTTRVDDLKLDVSGDLARLGIELTANGAVPDPFNLSGEAVVSREDEVTRATLERLSGEMAEVPVRLLAPATVRLENGTIELDGLDLQVDTARLQSQGSLTPTEVEGRLELTGFDLARLEAFGGPALIGGIESRWDLGGTPTAPTINGDVRIDGLKPGEGGDETVDIVTEVALDGGGLDATVTLGGLGAPALRANAQLPMQLSLQPFAFSMPTPLPLDAEVAGTIDLQQAAAWYALDGQEVSGTIEIDLSATGTAADPSIDGRIVTDDTRFVDVALGVVVDAVQLEVRGTRDSVEIVRLAASDGRGGSVDGQGRVGFGANGVDVDVSATMSEFAVVQQENIFVQMSGDTAVAGGTADLGVRSRLTVDKGDITIPSGGGAASFATLDVVTEQQLETHDEEPPPATPVGIDLDVQVEMPGGLFVRGRGLVSEWTGNIEVTGDAAEPRIVGLIEYRRGFINLLQNRFEFRKGEVRLTGDFPPDPFLDIEATVPAGDFTAILAVTGPALDPDISISSEPPLPEDEVMSQLIFGQDFDSLNTFQALRLASAVEELRGGRAFGDSLRTGLGLDTLEVGGESFDTATLRGGVYVSEDVFLEVEQGLSDQSGAVRVEVELTPSLKAEARVQEDQTSSIGVRWRRDY